MRKRLISQDGPQRQPSVDLETLAEVEITSEEAACPIELALRGESPGWRASGPGEQVIRLLFGEPLSVRTIELQFDEAREARTQEFVLRWSNDGGRSYRDIVRQQYTFSPPDTTREAEQYTVALDGVTTIELRIVPDIGGGAARATLSQIRVAQA